MVKCKAQKFPIGSQVRIASDLGPSMSHFPGAGCLATVEYSYAQRYGGHPAHPHKYSLVINEVGSSSWYREDQLTAKENEGVKYAAPI